MSKNTYVFRQLDPVADVFSCKGLMENATTTFTESVLEHQFQAVIAVATSPLNSKPKHDTVVDNAHGDPLKDLVDVIRFEIATNVTSKDNLRVYRSELREVIKRWAEKCRVKGIRGWRANAIKTPRFKTINGQDKYTMVFEVILGQSIFYSDYVVTINALYDLSFVEKDLQNLGRKVADILATDLDTIHYNHSRFGDGQIL